MPLDYSISHLKSNLEKSLFTPLLYLRFSPDPQLCVGPIVLSSFHVLLHSWHSSRPPLAILFQVPPRPLLPVFHSAHLFPPPLRLHSSSQDVSCAGAGIFICLVLSSPRAFGIHGIKCSKGVMGQRRDTLWWGRGGQGRRWKLAGINSTKGFPTKWH